MEESLITRYRPMTLDEVWGNDTIKEKWRGYVERREFPKSIILEGNYGLGKTSLALIFANDSMRLAEANKNGVLGADLHKFGRLDYEYKHIGEIVVNRRSTLTSPTVFFMDEVQMMPTKTQELLITPLDQRASRAGPRGACRRPSVGAAGARVGMTRLRSTGG